MITSDKLREISEKYFPTEEKLSNNSLYNQLQQSSQVNLLSDLTALISEHYVSREEHEKMKHNLTHCGSCGDPLSRDCPRCKHLWET